MLNSPEIALPGSSLIDPFYSDLLKHPRCSHFSIEQKKIIFQAGKIAEEFHKDEKRKVSGESYITHPIALVHAILDSKNVQGAKNKRRYPLHKSISILLLHDTLESCPERFEEIYDLVGMDIFCRVLKLSQLSPEYRLAIRDFLFEQLGNLSSYKRRKYRYVLSMLSHTPDIKDKMLNGRFKNKRKKFEKLCDEYRAHLDKYFPNLSLEKKEKEIDGLWHILFFDQHDTLHKLMDTMNNLSDVKDMKEKEYYKLRRIPKLLALLFVLDNHEMTHETDMLIQAWTSESVGGKSHQIIERRKQKFPFDYTELVTEQLRRINRISDGVKLIQEKTRKLIGSFQKKEPKIHS